MQPDQKYPTQSDQPTPQSTAGFSLGPSQSPQVPAEAVQPQLSSQPGAAPQVQTPQAMQFGQAPTQPPQQAMPINSNAQAQPEDDYDEEHDDEFVGDEDDRLLAWETQQQAGEHRPSQWYIIMGIVAAGSIVAAILLQSWFFIPLGVLVPIALTKYGSKGADAHSYELTAYGVTIDGKHYSYDDYKSFFEVDNQGQPTFELVPNKRFATLLTLHGTPEDADDIAEILGSVLPESEPEGYLGESILKRLKF